MKATRDYYDLLEIPRTATAEEIRAAHRKMARKHHPDINKDPAAAETLKSINLAFDVLSDPEKRARYDRFGPDYERYQDAPADAYHGGVHFGGAGAGTYAGPNGSTFTYSTSGAGMHGMGDHDLGDLFGSLFGANSDTQPNGRRSGRRRARRGQDVEYPVSLSIDEAFTGTTRTFELKLDEPCSECNGVGFTRSGTCATCGGSGTTPRRTRIEVNIPKGVHEGQRIRISGKGQPGVNGGEAGDVFLNVNFAPHPRFTIDGDDVRTTVPVPYTTLLLGGEAVVPTLTGRLALTIPAETQPGKVFRLRGQGWPRGKDAAQGRGDLLVEAQVVLPTNLSERERELITELRGLRDGSSGDL